jgi:hypothetical protein
MNNMDEATDLVIGLMITNMAEPPGLRRQGYSFANALYAASQRYSGLNSLEMFIVAERVLARILEGPIEFPDATLSVRKIGG